MSYFAIFNLLTHSFELIINRHLLFNEIAWWVYKKLLQTFEDKKIMKIAGAMFILRGVFRHVNG